MANLTHKLGEWSGEVLQSSIDCDPVMVRKEGAFENHIYPWKHHQTHYDTYVIGKVIVYADLRRLLEALGSRALHSKSGRAQSMNGLLVAKVVKRRVSRTEKIERPIPKGYIIHEK